MSPLACRSMTIFFYRCQITITIYLKFAIKCPRTRAAACPLISSLFSFSFSRKWLPTTALLVPIKCSQWPAPSLAWAREATRPWLRKFRFPTCHDVEILGAQGCCFGCYFSRVAICDYRGDRVLDCFVVPTMAVTDYRTSTTGITAAHLSSGRPIKN